MELRLTDDYRLTTDAYNYILQKRRVIQDEESENFGKESWSNVSYHGRFKDVISKLIDLEIKQSDVTDLQELEDLIFMVERDISLELERAFKHATSR